MYCALSNGVFTLNASLSTLQVHLGIETAMFTTAKKLLPSERLVLLTSVVGRWLVLLTSVVGRCLGKFP